MITLNLVSLSAFIMWYILMYIAGKARMRNIIFWHNMDKHDDGEGKKGEVTCTTGLMI